MRCTKCGTEGVSGQKFCAECGSPLSNRCAKLQFGQRTGREILRRMRHTSSIRRLIAGLRRHGERGERGAQPRFRGDGLEFRQQPEHDCLCQHSERAERGDGPGFRQQSERNILGRRAERAGHCEQSRFRDGGFKRPGFQRRRWSASGGI